MCLGIPGVVVSISDEHGYLGRVEIAGVTREVNLRCVVEPNETISDLVGRWVLVHVGFAMSILDEVEAEHTLRLLKELGEFQEQML